MGDKSKIEWTDASWNPIRARNTRTGKVGWAREIVQQCRNADVSCFVKQLGANAFDSARTARGESETLSLTNPKGGDPAEWPEDLRVREMPVHENSL